MEPKEHTIALLIFTSPDENCGEGTITESCHFFVACYSCFEFCGSNQGGWDHTLPGQTTVAVTTATLQNSVAPPPTSPRSDI